MIRRYLYPAIAVGLIALIAGAYITGRNHERTAIERDGLKANIETRERIDNAGNDVDDGNVDDRLRDVFE